MAALASLTVAANSVWSKGDGHAPWVGFSFLEAPCHGTNPANFGPYDYVLRKDMLRVVEVAHFTPRIEQLVGGENAAGPTSDLDYTLRVIPNHHRALNSVIQFHFLVKSRTYRESKKGLTGFKLKSPAECYLQRAIHYSPNDATSFMLYASLLHREGRLEQSAEIYLKALRLDANSPNIQYNYALLLVDLEDYSQALEIAKKLYEDNFPLPGLRNKLKNLGFWE